MPGPWLPGMPPTPWPTPAMPCPGRPCNTAQERAEPWPGGMPSHAGRPVVEQCHHIPKGLPG
eukprot:2391877-Lingulodinium_polyedra.AAC.1